MQKDLVRQMLYDMLLARDFEVRGFGSALLAALVMALLGLLGFVLVQWLMMGEVYWVYWEDRPGMRL